MRYAFNFRDIWAQWPSIAEGIGVTLVLTTVTMVAGLTIGTLGAAGRVYGRSWLRMPLAAYVEVVRNTPLLVQLFIVFFGLPSLGVRFDAMTAALIALSVNLGAYTTEIIRAGLEAVPRAQIEAGYSLGLSGTQVFRHVVLAPAIRIVYPALTSQFVLMMLATSIVSQISAPDLFHIASIIQSRTFRDFEIYAVIAMVYLALALTGLAFLGGSLVGLLIAVLRVSPVAPLRALGAGYISIVQGIPLLAWLFVFFFGLPILAGVRVSPWIAAMVAFSIYAGAFLGEIWRGCLRAIPHQQWEAGASLGLSFVEQLRHIIVPQAVRVAIPPTVGFLVQLIKNTSLAAVIGFIELTREGQLTTAATYRPFAVYIAVAAIYFALCFPLTQWSRRLERTLRVAR